MPFKMLTVCSGNSCRSPSWEVVLRDHLAAAGLGGLVTIDSAGTADYHIGEPPSEPARRLGSLRGYDLEPLRARQVAPGDFADFDLILAMDRGHLRQLRALQPPGCRCRFRVFRAVLPPAGPARADPSYGQSTGVGPLVELSTGENEQT